MSSEKYELVESNVPAVVERSAVLLAPVMDVNTAKQRMREFQAFIASYLVESDPEKGIDGDYGIIPGTKKSTLLKPGADKLCEVYGLYDEYELMSSVEDWDKGLFDYTLKCILKSRRDDSKVGTGVGSCSSFESKYRWRESKRVCPKCHESAIIKGQEQYGGGFVCWKKKDGCGAKFADNDKTITEQVVGRLENPDIIDQKNTVLKMAKKRAKIDAVIGVTRSSGIFTQDMEDAAIVTVAPAVAHVPLTTEDIEIGGPARSSGDSKVDQRKGPTEESSKPSETLEFITIGEQRALHRAFRDSLATDELKTKADAILKGWLVHNKYVDKDGAPTTKLISKFDFDTVKMEMVHFAESLK